MCILNLYCVLGFFIFFFKQKTAYEMRISDWSSDVCSSDLVDAVQRSQGRQHVPPLEAVMDGRDHQVEGVRRDAGVLDLHAEGRAAAQIGRASCRERVCQYV